MKILLDSKQVSMEEEGRIKEKKSVYNSMRKYLPEMLLIAGSMLLIRK